MTKLLLSLALCVATAGAQPLENIRSQAELVKTVASLDAAVFDAYNRCDLPKFASFFADDVEFYHDSGRRDPGQREID
jgi:hypothetical protein